MITSSVSCHRRTERSVSIDYALTTLYRRGVQTPTRGHGTTRRLSHANAWSRHVHCLAAAVSGRGIARRRACEKQGLVEYKRLFQVVFIHFSTVGQCRARPRVVCRPAWAMPGFGSATPTSTSAARPAGGWRIGAATQSGDADWRDSRARSLNRFFIFLPWDSAEPGLFADRPGQSQDLVQQLPASGVTDGSLRQQHPYTSGTDMGNGSFEAQRPQLV
jgi:hypothetical protein